MTYKQAVKEFQTEFRDLYIRRVDYWSAQIVWADYVDHLHREGKITDRQIFMWETPFPYRKHLVPKKWQLELEVNSRII